MIEDENGSLLRQAAAALVLFAASVIIESFTSADMRLQLVWWSEESSEWLITKAAHAEWRWLFYGGAKKAVAVCGGAALAAGLAGLAMGKARVLRGGMLVLAAVILVPLLVGLLKKTTNVYCPYELIDFGGKAVYQHVLDMADPANAPICRGNCFPAGHASGGFALMMLFYCMKGGMRWAGLLVGLAAGWTMGLYQMLRGDHFLTHTLATMFLAWGVCALLAFLWNAAADRLGKKYELEKRFRVRRMRRRS